MKNDNRMRDILDCYINSQFEKMGDQIKAYGTREFFVDLCVHGVETDIEGFDNFYETYAIISNAFNVFYKGKRK